MKMLLAVHCVVRQGLGASASMGLGSLLFGGLLFGATAVWAEPGNDDSRKTLPEVEQIEEKKLAVGEEAGSQEMVCRSVRVTGTRKRTQTCQTRADWSAMRRNAEDTVRTTQQQPTGHFENTGGGTAPTAMGGGG